MRSNARRAAALTVGLLAIAALAAVGSIADGFDGWRHQLQRSRVEVSALGRGPTADILQQLDLAHLAPDDDARFDWETPGRDDRSPGERHEHTYRIDRPEPERLPSTTLVPRYWVDAGLPLLSVAIDRHDLRDPEQGLLTHRMARGRDWERPAYVSYFDQGRLRFATGAGIRVHGGKSRRLPRPSFRLYFRPEYGHEQVDDGLLFDDGDWPVRRLVIHNDVREDSVGRSWHLVNPLAYDIARRVGALAPRTRPAWFFLNGELQGLYVLTEYLDTEYLASRYGHDDFVLVRTKKERGAPMLQAGDPRRYDALVGYLRRGALSVPELASRIDLDNFARWSLSILYCATTDPFQGPLVLDQSAPDARWFWINWDMDHSFMDIYAGNDRGWEHDAFGDLRGTRLPREILFSHLLDDPGFGARFRDLLVETLNHRLTPDWVASRIDHYERQAVAFRLEDLEFIDRLREFARQRHAVLRRQAGVQMGLGDSHRWEVAASDGGVLRVDGHRIDGSYEGWYFDDMVVRIEVPAARAGDFRHWRVDGAVLYSGPALELPVRGPGTIEAVFGDQ